MAEPDPVLEAWEDARRAAEDHPFSYPQLMVAAQNGLLGLNARQTLHLTVDRCAACEDLLVQTWSRRPPSEWVLDDARELVADTTLRAALDRHLGMPAPAKRTARERVQTWLDELGARWLGGAILQAAFATRPIDAADRGAEASADTGERETGWFGPIQLSVIADRPDQLRVTVHRELLGDGRPLLVLVFLIGEAAPLVVARFAAASANQEQVIDVPRALLASPKLRVVVGEVDG